MTSNYSMLISEINVSFSHNQRAFRLKQIGIDVETHSYTLYGERECSVTQSSKWDTSIKSLPQKLRAHHGEESRNYVRSRGDRDTRITRSSESSEEVSYEPTGTETACSVFMDLYI